MEDRTNRRQESGTTAPRDPAHSDTEKHPSDDPGSTRDEHAGTSTEELLQPSSERAPAAAHNVFEDDDGFTSTYKVDEEFKSPPAAKLGDNSAAPESQASDKPDTPSARAESEMPARAPLAEQSGPEPAPPERVAPKSEAFEPAPNRHGSQEPAEPSREPHSAEGPMSAGETRILFERLYQELDKSIHRISKDIKKRQGLFAQMHSDLEQARGNVNLRLKRELYSAVIDVIEGIDLQLHKMNNDSNHDPIRVIEGIRVHLLVLLQNEGFECDPFEDTEEGERFDTNKHIMGVLVETNDPEKDRLVARTTAPAYIMEGRPFRKKRVNVYKYVEPKATEEEQSR